MIDGLIPGLLQEVALEALRTQTAVLPGDVIGPREPLIGRSRREALYATTPSYFPVDFGSCLEGSVAIAIVWLVPISHGEAHLSGTEGGRPSKTC